MPIINLLYTQSAVYYHKYVKGIPFPHSGVKYVHEAWFEK